MPRPGSKIVSSGKLCIIFRFAVCEEFVKVSLTLLFSGAGSLISSKEAVYLAPFPASSTKVKVPLSLLSTLTFLNEKYPLFSANPVPSESTYNRV